MVEEKGYLELFQAFRKIIKRFPKTILLIIGPEEPEKKDRINPRVAFKQFGIENNVLYLGERTDVDELYPLMDIFVLPSYREGVGISILEASAMERPVIASNIGGCPEAVDNNKTGILILAKDSKKLFQTIIYLMENPEIAKKMGLAGREKIKREFNEKDLFVRMQRE